jgi:hypothetical protein
MTKESVESVCEKAGYGPGFRKDVIIRRPDGKPRPRDPHWIEPATSCVNFMGIKEAVRRVVCSPQYGPLVLDVHVFESSTDHLVDNLTISVEVTN